MGKIASVDICIDSNIKLIKSDVEKIYSQYGISLTDAIGGLPFDLRPKIPNEVTLAAMKEGDDMINGRLPMQYLCVDDFVKEMGEYA